MNEYKLPDKDQCSRAATILKALSHQQRLFILCCLHQKECTVSDLEKYTNASQPLISQHLTRMRLEGIVESRRDGNYVYYRIADPHVSALVDTMEKLFGL
jgi:DNA-binding transcriptional ArsR family regulator